MASSSPPGRTGHGGLRPNTVVKGVGEPCAGEPHARFDGGELEKELAMAAEVGGFRETGRPEPGVAYGRSPRQLHTRPSAVRGSAALRQLAGGGQSCCRRI